MKKLAIVVMLSFLASCTCGTKTCPPGSNECPCKENACDTGLVCQANNTCGAAVAATIAVSDLGARGCEVVLTEQGTTVANVSFADGVVGTSVREAPRVAVSFVSATDAQLPTNGVKLGLSGASSGLVVSKVTCVDSKGVKLPGATLSVR